MWYLFHGPNTLTRDEEIGKFKAKMGEPDIASLNTAEFDKTAGLKDILGAADSMPFLSDKRLVIVHGWVSAQGTPKKAKAGKADKDKNEEALAPIAQLTAYLQSMPDTTRLVIAEDEALPDSHPLVKLLADKANGGAAKLFELPDNPVKWITERAKSKGGEITPQAATLLSTKINRGDKNDRDHFVSDSRTYLHKLDNELEKLAAYALNRKIEPADIEALVKDEDFADIFKFIDAISQRDGEAAFKFVRGVLTRGESPLVVLTHIARQTRLLIMAKDNAGMTPDQLAQHIGVHPYVAKKSVQQAGRFSMAELERAHISSLEADIAIKTGQMDDVTALDVLVATLCA